LIRPCHFVGRTLGALKILTRLVTLLAAVLGGPATTQTSPFDPPLRSDQDLHHLVDYPVETAMRPTVHPIAIADAE